MITQIKFVGIPVSDQERALAFYTEKLGFEVATDQPMGPGKRWIELRIAHSQTRVVLFTPDGQEDRIGTFFNGSIACDDVEATHRQLSATRRRVRRAADEAAVGHVREVQGSRRQHLRAVVELSEGGRAPGCSRTSCAARSRRRRAGSTRRRATRSSRGARCRGRTALSFRFTCWPALTRN